MNGKQMLPPDVGIERKPIDYMGTCDSRNYWEGGKNDSGRTCLKHWWTLEKSTWSETGTRRRRRRKRLLSTMGGS